SSDEEVEKALDAALEMGYRHIDTAYNYRNEAAIGRALKKWIDSGKVKREELFIVTKLPLIGNQKDKVAVYLQKSLTALNLTYVDLYLVHAPIGLKDNGDDNIFPMDPDGTIQLDLTTDLVSVWKARERHDRFSETGMEEQVDAGRAKSIGISNFNEEQVTRIVKNARIKPANIQVELQAYFQQKPLRELCKKHDITVVAYGPLGSPGRVAFYEKLGISKDKAKVPDLLQNPVVKKIARKHHVTEAQVLLRHLAQSGIAVIPKSTNPSRIQLNYQIFNFELSSDEMRQLNDLDQGEAGRSFLFELKGVDAHPEYPLKDFAKSSDEEMEKALDTALEMGYRHLDTAYNYRNEASIGRVLKKWIDSGKVKREELFIVTKLPMIGNQKDKVAVYLQKSLTALNLTYVDLYLVHGPFGLKDNGDDNIFPMDPDGTIQLDLTTDLVSVWKARKTRYFQRKGLSGMEEQVDAGRAKSIGISNFSEEQVTRIVKNARIKPANIQVELHAYFQQKPLRELCKKHDITVVAYGPLGSPGRVAFYEKLGMSKDHAKVPDLLQNPVVKKIAREHHVTEAQVLLRHLAQSGIAVIPKSSNPSRIQLNYQIFNFELSSDEMKQLNDLDQGEAGRTFFFEFKGVEAHPEFPLKDWAKKGMEEQVDADRAKSTGISNFNEEQVARIVKNARIKPANIQVELHAHFQQKSLRELCEKHGITIVA
ncbi:unnamed protein product, partial [Darwinula stevensoni]